MTTPGARLVPPDWKHDDDSRPPVKIEARWSSGDGCYDIVAVDHKGEQFASGLLLRLHGGVVTRPPFINPSLGFLTNDRGQIRFFSNDGPDQFGTRGESTPSEPVSSRPWKDDRGWGIQNRHTGEIRPRQCESNARYSAGGNWQLVRLTVEPVEEVAT